MNLESVFGRGEKRGAEREIPRRLPDGKAREIVEKNLGDLGRDSGLSHNTIFKAETIRAIGRLVLELKDRIPRYETIISDDASGRLISLLLRKVINAERKNLELPPVKTYFVAGGRNLPEVESLIGKFISEKKSGFGKTLLVTEHIATGASIESLVKQLNSGGADFDVAAVSIGSKPQNRLYENKTFKDRLIYGEVGEAGLYLYDKIHRTGVVKHGSHADGEPSPHPKIYPLAQRTDVADARGDVDALADRLVKMTK